MDDKIKALCEEYGVTAVETDDKIEYEGFESDEKMKEFTDKANEIHGLIEEDDK